MIEVQEVEARALTFPEKARLLVIETSDQYVAAAEFLKSIKSVRGEIDETFSPMTKKAHEAWKETLRQRERIEAPLIEAEQIAKALMVRFNEQQDRIRKQEELRLEKEAREEDERSRLAYADVLHEVGHVEEANRVLSEPAPLPPVILPRSTPKVAGISSTTTYSAQLVDMKALLTAILAGRVPMMAVSANMVFLNQQARSMKESFNVPGVKLNTTTNITARKF